MIYLIRKEKAMSNQDKQTAIEAAVFRRLIEHLQHRTDAQNIDLMGLAGFCRNCFGKWYYTAAQEEGLEISKEDARDHIYGMPYGEYKEKYQTTATDEQLALMDESVAKNKK